MRDEGTVVTMAMRPASCALTATEPLPEAAYRLVRRRTLFEGFKWDPQVGDVETLGRFALVLGETQWRRLAATAERLARETLALEEALLSRPDLIAELGLPRPVARVLRRRACAPDEPTVRMMRFDFHPTDEGWALSEVNSDVPGGQIEAGFFTRAMAEYFPDCTPPPDPGARLAEALARRLAAGPPGVVAMVHATAFADDRQVMESLARELTARGLQPRMAAPDHVRFEREGAELVLADAREPVAALVRFFPAEWLPNLPRAARWPDYFAPRPGVVACNPATALLSQSKRLPLVWGRLPDAACSAWKACLPETRSPRDGAWHRENSGAQWVIKPVWGRVGDAIAIQGLTGQRRWRRAVLRARLFPGHWVVQRRFRALPLPTPVGERYPCLGVYVIDGQAAGLYGRLAKRPLVDHRACDVAVLLGREQNGERPRPAPHPVATEELPR